MVLDQFLPRNRMVLLPEAHILTPLPDLVTKLHSRNHMWFRPVHSYRGTFIATTGVNVVESTRGLQLGVGNNDLYNTHEALQWKQRWANKRCSFVLWSL